MRVRNRMWMMSGWENAFVLVAIEYDSLIISNFTSVAGMIYSHGMYEMA